MNKLIQRKSAFSLVEVTLALGIAAFCLISIFGLLPVGVNSNKDSIEQTLAINIISALVSDLKSTAKTSPASPMFGLSTTSPTTIYLLEDGSVASRDKARFRAQIKMAAVQGRCASTGNILISWPAQQEDTSKAAGFVETFIALDRN